MPAHCGVLLAHAAPATACLTTPHQHPQLSAYVVPFPLLRPAVQHALSPPLLCTSTAGTGACSLAQAAAPFALPCHAAKTSPFCTHTFDFTHACMHVHMHKNTTNTHGLNSKHTQQMECMLAHSLLRLLSRPFVRQKVHSPGIGPAATAASKRAWTATTFLCLGFAAQQHAPPLQCTSRYCCVQLCTDSHNICWTASQQGRRRTTHQQAAAAGSAARAAGSATWRAATPRRPGTGPTGRQRCQCGCCYSGTAQSAAAAQWARPCPAGQHSTQGAASVVQAVTVRQAASVCQADCQGRARLAPSVRQAVGAALPKCSRL